VPSFLERRIGDRGPRGRADEGIAGERDRFRVSLDPHRAAAARVLGRPTPFK